MTILDGFCHYCDLRFLQVQYTKVCPTLEISLIFWCPVCSLAPVCTGSEVAQGMQGVAAHLEAHDLHLVAWQKYLWLNWNMACEVSGGQHSSTEPHLWKNELTLVLLSCVVTQENACSAVCGNLVSHSPALNMETHALIQKPFQNCRILLVSAMMT